MHQTGFEPTLARISVRCLNRLATGACEYGWTAGLLSPSIVVTMSCSYSLPTIRYATPSMIMNPILGFEPRFPGLSNGIGTSPKPCFRIEAKSANSKLHHTGVSSPSRTRTCVLWSKATCDYPTTLQGYYVFLYDNLNIIMYLHPNVNEVAQIRTETRLVPNQEC